MTHLTPQEVIDLINGDIEISNAYIEKQVTKLRKAFELEALYGWSGPRLNSIWTLQVMFHWIKENVGEEFSGTAEISYFETMLILYPIETAIIGETPLHHSLSPEAGEAMKKMLADYYLNTYWPNEGEVSSTAWLKAIKRAHDYMSMQFLEGDAPKTNYYVRNPQRFGMSLHLDDPWYSSK